MKEKLSLLLSNDKEKVLAAAKREAEPEDPKGNYKRPMVLEFLRLKPQAAYYEKDLEQALINLMKTLKNARLDKTTKPSFPKNHIFQENKKY
ncbi:MAG TPA: hypothetical protein VLZ83_13390 [Edaphocola sp.]|nr:hypothetical protein [Edaphocola sp.]